MALVLNGDMQERPGELLKRLPELYHAASRKATTLEDILEQEDDSREWGDTDDRRAGAFGRVIAASGIRFKSNPVEGLWASRVEDVWGDPVARALVPAWSASVWRRARSGGYAVQVRPGASRAASNLMGSDEFGLGTIFRPYVDAAGIYGQDLTPGLRLDDLVAFESSINGDSVRRAFMTDPVQANVRLSRITEKSDIPRSNIDLTESSTRLYKYGRGIEMSYEAVRRVPVDKVGMFIAQAAVQVEADRVAQAIDIAINGDGEAGSSADNYTQASLDTGTAVTVKGFLAFKAKWPDPYALNLIVAREAELVNLQMLQMPNNTPFFQQVNGELGFGGLTPLRAINGQTVYFAQNDAVGAGVYLGLDTRYAIERITEAGSNIQETMKFVERQTEALFFTENDGFGLLDPRSNKTWSMT